MNAFDGQIKISVIGLKEVQDLEAKIGRMSKVVRQGLRLNVDAKGNASVESLVVNLERVNKAATQSRKLLELVDTNYYTKLKGAVNTYVDSLEQQLSVQSKINKAVEAEIASRNRLRNARQASLAETRNVRQSSNFGFGLAGDAVAKSIRRAEEKRLAIQVKLNAERDKEVARLNQIRGLVERNVSASARSREASNFGFGLGGDAVAKSIRRAEEKRLAIQVKLNAERDKEITRLNQIRGLVERNVSASARSRES